MIAAGSNTDVAPRVLVDLAALERAPLTPRAPPRGPYSPRPISRPVVVERAAGRMPPAVNVVERRALLTIGRLARYGRIVLCSYSEFESPGRPADWPGSWRELLGDVPLSVISPALAHDALGEDVFHDGPHSGALARLCARLEQWDTAGTGPDTAPPGTSDGARSLDRFHELAARVQGARLADLYHLWTAECASCAWWLTLDPELAHFLRDWVEPGLRQPLRCEPVFPNTLLVRLGIFDRDRTGDDDNRVVPLPLRPPP